MKRIREVVIEDPQYIGTRNFGNSGNAVVTATFDDGTEAEVLRYHTDELQFRPSEFVGLSRDHIHALFQRRYEAALRL